MIEIYQLKQFLAVVECGTLSDAAEKLHLSQPALSRNMKKLEDDMGVPLFDRQRNKMTINENGRLTATLAEKVIDDIDNLCERVRAFDKSCHTLSVGLCAPAPGWRLMPLLAEHFPGRMVQTVIDNEQVLLRRLESGELQLIVLTYKPQDEQFPAKYFDSEHLMLSVTKDHRFAERDSVTFAELNGENMLLFSDIGVWHDIPQKHLPDSRFIMQYDRFSFTELVNASVLPCFTTNLVHKYSDFESDRIDIPIEDDDATVNFYLVYRKEDSRLFEHLI